MFYDIDINATIGCPISAAYIKAMLEGKEGKEVRVRINSYGGDVNAALDIRRQFIDHGNVTVYIYGMTASAATILATGAKRTYISRYALYLAHPCSSIVDTWGPYNGEDLERLISDLLRTHKTLQTIDELVAGIYAARSGKTMLEMAKVMKEAKWLTSDEVVNIGLADGLVEEKEEEPRPNMTVDATARLVAMGMPPVPATPWEAAIHTNKIKSNKQNVMDATEKTLPELLNVKKAFEEAGIALDTLKDGIATLDADNLTALDIYLGVLFGKLSEAEKETELADVSEELPVNETADAVKALRDEIATMRTQVAALLADDGAETDRAGLATDTEPNAHQSAAERYRRIKNLL